MRILLKDFQEQYTSQLVDQMRKASGEARSGSPQAVILSSPTGSGKTIMMTAAIERLLVGDAKNPRDAEATFLWITDQPELNEQTRRKMLQVSSVLGPSHLVVVDASFNLEVFSPGRVYFINIQKLAKEKLLVTRGDSRHFTIWDSIRNTVTIRPGSFYLLIDEAHRGMTENIRARDEAVTIIQKFIKGFPGEIPAIPLIVGISATPERFENLTRARTTRPVTIEPDDVRASGLLKEVVTLYHPTEAQPSDMTMLRAAARTWSEFVSRWEVYCKDQAEPAVRPILVVQVQDGTGNRVSRTDLVEAIRAINDEVGPLPDYVFGHSFQEGADLDVGGRKLRYIAPPDIQSDPDIKIVFFKTSLNTGWDCPPAEVMMSFRSAQDATSIAQLVGRMVRTPLARRVDADEYLNTVALYLPHYDQAPLNRIVARLTAPDPDFLPPVTVRQGSEVVVLDRRAGTEEAFTGLAHIPSYIIPKSRKTSQVHRVMKLARLLANDGLNEEGPEEATRELVDVLQAEYERLKETDSFKALVQSREKVQVEAISIQLGGRIEEEDGFEINVSAENIDDLFDWAGRRLGEGLHKAWWRQRVITNNGAKTVAKLECVALSMDGATLDRLQSSAQRAVNYLFETYYPRITYLPEAQRQAYEELRRLGVDPERTTLVYPKSVEGATEGRAYPLHLYVDGGETFRTTLNSWEHRVLEEELARNDIVGWLRNPDRKPWSLCIPYRMGGEVRPLFPDFLVVRRTPNGVVVDLLDPHLISLVDAPAKAAGLAEYADKHGYEYGRIEVIIVDGERIKRLNVKDESVRRRVMGVTSPGHLKDLFDIL